MGGEGGEVGESTVCGAEEIGEHGPWYTMCREEHTWRVNDVCRHVNRIFSRELDVWMVSFAK